MSDGSRARRLAVLEDLSLTVPDNPSCSPSQSRSAGGSAILAQPSQDLVVRGPRKKEPRHVPSKDEKRRLRVYSNRANGYTEININVVRDIDECWISEHAVEQLKLKRKPNNLTGEKEFGILGLQSFQFRGTVLLQWLCESNSQPTRCRIIPGNNFEIYLPSNLLSSSLQRTVSAADTLSNPSPSDVTENLTPAVSAVDASSEFTGQFDGDVLEEAADGSKEAIRADEWMDEMKKVHDRNSNSARDQHKKPIKVAVLDTGIDFEHGFIKGAMKKPRRIKATRDFVDKGNNIQDFHGHGTHVAALLLKVAPDAQLYIAKVANGGKIPASHNIADAIKWAIECEVDIITMSFGIDKDHPAMQKEINEAYNNNIIIFAAASNKGHNHDVPFPARRSTEVLCIYATDGVGNAYDGNPTLLEDSAYHFATLGVAVKSAWVQTNDNESDGSEVRRKTGTSFATPIAAGIAAYVLDFALVNGIGEESYRILRTRAGMERIFAKHLTGKNETTKLNYIHPWKLFADRRKDETILSLIQDTLEDWTGPTDKAEHSNGEMYK